MKDFDSWCLDQANTIEDNTWTGECIDEFSEINFDDTIVIKQEYINDLMHNDLRMRLRTIGQCLTLGYMKFYNYPVRFLVKHLVGHSYLQYTKFSDYRYMIAHYDDKTKLTHVKTIDYERAMEFQRRKSYIMCRDVDTEF